MSDIFCDGHGPSTDPRRRAYETSILNPLYYKYLATPLIIILLLTGKPEQQRFTLLFEVTGNDTRWRSASSAFITPFGGSTQNTVNNLHRNVRR